MKRIIAAIEAEGKRMAGHAFFQRIDQEPMETLIPVLAYNTGFWNFAFQDLIHAVDGAVTSPEFKPYAREHLIEDAGHHIWFIQDIHALGYAWDSRVFSYFEKSNYFTRIHTYKIFSELYRMTDDRLRVALLLAIESPGHVFFGKMSQYMSKFGISQKMKYFGQSHIEVEKEHTVFNDQSENHLHAVVLEDAVAEEGIAMVQRIHQLFHDLADEMLRQLDNPSWVAEISKTPKKDMQIGSFEHVV